MTAVIYTSTAIADKKGLEAFNASHFPCHPKNTTTVYLNGSNPTIQELCNSAGIECLPFSEYTKPKPKSKTTKEPK